MPFPARAEDFARHVACPAGALAKEGAKRAAIFSEWLQSKILADVPHAQWVFSIPKMLRPYFLHHRELLGNIARLAYETVREMMAVAVDLADARPGLVAVHPDLQLILMRAPVNLSRLRFDKDSGLLVYLPKPGHELDDNALSDPLEFLPRVLIQSPSPTNTWCISTASTPTASDNPYRDYIRGEDEARPTPSPRAINKRWAELIFRIYLLDPLTCNQCGGKMKILASITDPTVIRTMLHHRNKITAEPTAPPTLSTN